ncbi:uncharacterized protein LOC144435530 [Glandiceps talaboti]
MPAWWKSSGTRDHETVDYDRIPLTSKEGCDSEDEEIFNGSTVTSSEHFDVEVLTENGRTDTRHTLKSVKSESSWKRSLCFIGCIVLSIGVVFFLYFGLPCPQSTGSWHKEFPGFASESVVRLYDVNSDGILDMLFGTDIEGGPLTEDVAKQLCHKYGLEPPCGGRIIALDGRNGNSIWNTTVPHEIFELNCGNIDINQDDVMDCLASGRMGVLVAINPKTGDILWTIQKDVTNKYCNIYQPQVVPDMDSDGVLDLVITHGGDMRYNNEEHNRTAGRIMLISGATGKCIGGQYLEMPDGQETYSSPVLYTHANGVIHILFGSGGETIKGSLWAISLLDLYNNIIPAKDGIKPPFPANYNGYSEPWGKVPRIKHNNGFIELVRSEAEVGVMVPVVLGDLNNDTIDDIVVSVFNGTIAVLDGDTLELIWTTGDRFDGYQFYSTPALGYFNDDDTLDVMVHVSWGVWQTYNLTVHVILDGRNGDVLWSLRTSQYTMSSPLVIRSSNKKDVFVFWAKGRQGLVIEDQINTLQKRTRRHGAGGGPEDEEDDFGDDYDEYKHLRDCEVIDGEFLSEILLMDRDYSKTPIRVLKEDSIKTNYSVVYHNILAMSDSDQEMIKSLTEEEKVNMTKTMMKEVAGLSAEHRETVLITLKHLPDEERTKLRKHIQEEFGSLSITEDELQKLMMHHIMIHVLNLSDMLRNEDGTPVGMPQRVPEDHGSEHISPDDPHQADDRPKTDSDMPSSHQQNSSVVPTPKLLTRVRKPNIPTPRPRNPPTPKPQQSTQKLRHSDSKPNADLLIGHVHHIKPLHRRHSGSGEEDDDDDDMDDIPLATVDVNTDGEMCVRKAVETRPTGAIGEVDGEFYYFALSVYSMIFYDSRGIYLDSASTFGTVARKISLSDILKRGEVVQLSDKHVTLEKTIHSEVPEDGNAVDHFSFSPYNIQPWLEYMGTSGTGNYTAGKPVN